MKVVTPGEPGAGQFYSSYCEQWMSWIVSNNPETNNYGPVYFLHSMSCREQGGSYNIQPVVRIGAQAITVNAGEYVLMPVITSAAEAIDSGVPDNPTSLLDYVRTDLESGDNPPHDDQVTIAIDPDPKDPSKIQKENVTSQLADHLIISNVFSLYVPPAQQGASLLRTCFDVPINTEGIRNCVVGGWWVLIRFTKPNKRYYLHSFAKGRGQYQAAMFYQINVGEHSSRTTVAVPSKPADWSRFLIESVVKKKQTDGEIDNDQVKSVTEVLK